MTDKRKRPGDWFNHEVYDAKDDCLANLNSKGCQTALERENGWRQCGGIPAQKDPVKCINHGNKDFVKKLKAAATKSGGKSTNSGPITEIKIESAEDVERMLAKSMELTWQKRMSRDRANALARLANQWTKTRKIASLENQVKELEQRLERRDKQLEVDNGTAD